LKKATDTEEIKNKVQNIIKKELSKKKATRGA